MKSVESVVAFLKKQTQFVHFAGDNAENMEVLDA
jgi:hypothetical protein